MKQCILVCLFFSLVQLSNAQQNKFTAKNVLIIYSDDQSYNTLGVMGNQLISTPHLDKLAKSGMLFTQTHVMGGHQGAVCIPSRVMLLTGRYVNRLPGDGGNIPDSIISLPEVLQQRGYTTYHTGKWHSDRASHHRMFNAGGDIFFGGIHFPNDGGQFHPTVYKFDSTGNYKDSDKRISDTFSSTLYANNAIQFLNSAKAKNKPFFCYVAFTSPHDPRTPPEQFVKMYENVNIPLPPNFATAHPFDNGDMKVRDEQLLPRPLDTLAVKKDIAMYYGMVSEMDEQVGRILEALEKNNLTKNTLIIFAGDNGLAVGQHGLLGKQNLYEHSIRVPMMMAGPGIPKNKHNNGFTYLSDINPTIYEYLHINAPITVEAKSLIPAINNPSKHIRSNIYNVYGNWSRSIKTEDGFKLILYYVDDTKTTQLFNLKSDPWETKNLANDPIYRKKINELRALLSEEMEKAHDNIFINLPNWGRTDKMKKRGS